MKVFRILLVIFTLIMMSLFVKAALAQAPCSSGTCVATEDLKAFIQLANDQKCRQLAAPTLTLQPITVVVDREGRIYGSGSEPRPYTIQMHWCNYDLTGTGVLHMAAAQHIDSVWGFRARPKFGAGLFLINTFTESNWTSSVDVAFMLDFAYYKDFNLNMAAGLRGAGFALGTDITRNFGAFAGYGLSWGQWRSNPTVGLYFSF